MIYIRGNHPYHYRSGEWAHLFSIQHNEDGKDIWIVEFPDGATDAWPAWDRVAQYEVRVQIEHPSPDDVDEEFAAQLAKFLTPAR